MVPAHALMAGERLRRARGEGGFAALLVGEPEMPCRDPTGYVEKLTEMIRHNELAEITVANVLVEKFDIKPVATVQEDIEAMMAGR